MGFLRVEQSPMISRNAKTLIRIYSILRSLTMHAECLVQPSWCVTEASGKTEYE